VRAAIASGVFLMAVAGCRPAPLPLEERADYSATLNRYYEGRPLCLWPDTVKFPVEDATPEVIDERGFDALTDAGLLSRRPAGKGAPEGSYTFDLSPEGRSALNPDVFNPGAGNFCYGRRKVLSVDAARENSTTTEVVDFRYGLPGPAWWATQHSIQSAFPQVVTELEGPHRAEATLLDTTDGWEVSGMPATIVPPATRPHMSALAKARRLLRLKKKQSS